MTLSDLKKRIPDYAKDLRLNLTSVLSEEGAPGLNETQVWGTAVACAYACRNVAFAKAIEVMATEVIGDEEVVGAKASAAIMGMNNVYYRFLHLVDDEQYGQLPAKLRMNVIGRPGIDKVNFELYSLAVSSINACELCVGSHEKTLRKEGLGVEAVQSSVRIASVINAVAVILEHEGID
jgi:alkyl hydroperoxide reductase subunit D